MNGNTGSARQRAVRLALALGLLAALCACKTVRFNERERLSQADMQFDHDPLQAQIDAHVLQARQGAAGDFAGGGGGGCGCF